MKVGETVTMPTELWEHLREECTDGAGEPKLFAYLNGHKCEKCAEIVRWAAHPVPAVAL